MSVLAGQLIINSEGLFKAISQAVLAGIKSTVAKTSNEKSWY